MEYLALEGATMRTAKTSSASLIKCSGKAGEAALKTRFTPSQLECLNMLMTALVVFGCGDGSCSVQSVKKLMHTCTHAMPLPPSSVIASPVVVLLWHNGSLVTWSRNVCC